ncbi:putative ensconsin-like [Cocos nucifera]|nr:putative ensconsin-like [Cocos nucifera]
MQAMPTPEPPIATLSSILPDEVAVPLPPGQEETIEGQKKKKAIRKKARRVAKNFGGKSSNQEQAFLDDREVVQSLMKGSILLHIIDKMIRKEDAERFDESFTSFLKLGHYLFAHSKVADLRQVEFSKALYEVQAKIERVRTEVDRLKAALKEQTTEVDCL